MRLPDAVVACVGGGSNAIGAFSPFLSDEKVALFGVEYPTYRLFVIALGLAVLAGLAVGRLDLASAAVRVRLAAAGAAAATGSGTASRLPPSTPTAPAPCAPRGAMC